MALSVPYTLRDASSPPAFPDAYNQPTHKALPTSNTDKSAQATNALHARNTARPLFHCPKPDDSSRGCSKSSDHNYASQLLPTPGSRPRISLAYATHARIRTRKKPCPSATGTTACILLPPLRMLRHGIMSAHWPTPGKPLPQPGRQKDVRHLRQPHTERISTKLSGFFPTDKPPTGKHLSPERLATATDRTKKQIPQETTMHRKRHNDVSTTLHTRKPQPEPPAPASTGCLSPLPIAHTH